MSTPTFTVIQRPNAIFDETDKTKEMFSKWILNALRHPHGFNPRLNDVITFEVDFTEKTEPEAKIRTFILEGTSVHCLCSTLNKIERKILYNLEGQITTGPTLGSPRRIELRIIRSWPIIGEITDTGEIKT